MNWGAVVRSTILLIPVAVLIVAVLWRGTILERFWANAGHRRGRFLGFVEEHPVLDVVIVLAIPALVLMPPNVTGVCLIIGAFFALASRALGVAGYGDGLSSEESKHPVISTAKPTVVIALLVLCCLSIAIGAEFVVVGKASVVSDLNKDFYERLCPKARIGLKTWFYEGFVPGKACNNTDQDMTVVFYNCPSTYDGCGCAVSEGVGFVTVTMRPGSCHDSGRRCSKKP